MSDALRMAVVRLATDPAAYEVLIREPERALASVPSAERQMLLAGDVAGLASALAAPVVHPVAPTWIPGWPQACVWPPGWNGHAPRSAMVPTAWPAWYARLPGWPAP